MHWGRTPPQGRTGPSPAGAALGAGHGDRTRRRGTRRGMNQHHQRPCRQSVLAMAIMCTLPPRSPMPMWRRRLRVRRPSHRFVEGTGAMPRLPCCCTSCFSLRPMTLRRRLAHLVSMTVTSLDTHVLIMICAGCIVWTNFSILAVRILTAIMPIHCPTPLPVPPPQCWDRHGERSCARLARRCVLCRARVLGSGTSNALERPC